MRIAVRAIESWLLADQERLAEFLGISVQRLPSYPDQLNDPKATLLELVKHSPKKKLREDMLPLTDKLKGKIGPGYTGRILEFVEHSPKPWRPEVAAQHSDSLSRCIRALKNWQPVNR